MDPNQINELITQAKHKDDRAMEKLFAEFKPQLVSLVDTYYHKYPYNVYVQNNLHGDELFRELMYQEDFNDMLNELNIPTGAFAEILPYVAFEQAVAQSTSDYDLQSLLTTWVKTLFKKAYDSKTNGGTKPMPRFESQMMLENAMSRLAKLYRNQPDCHEAIDAVRQIAMTIMESESSPSNYHSISQDANKDMAHKIITDIFTSMDFTTICKYIIEHTDNVMWDWKDAEFWATVFYIASGCTESDSVMYDRRKIDESHTIQSYGCFTSDRNVTVDVYETLYDEYTDYDKAPDTLWCVYKIVVNDNDNGKSSVVFEANHRTDSDTVTNEQTPEMSHSTANGIQTIQKSVN